MLRSLHYKTTVWETALVFSRDIWTGISSQEKCYELANFQLTIKLGKADLVKHFWV